MAAQTPEAIADNIAHGCTCHSPYVMTRAEWKAKHRDFKDITNGQRSALRYCPIHGTTSAPVTIAKGGA